LTIDLIVSTIRHAPLLFDRIPRTDSWNATTATQNN
jgi:hypothetical protein